MVDYKRDIKKLFTPGKELVVFKTKEELKEAVRFYLNNPERRRRIADAGRKRALKEHTYKHRLSVILKSVGLKL